MKKPISRKAGRSSTAAAAYRSAERIMDLRTGEIHDYRKKEGVMFSQIVVPTGCEMTRSRSEFWNDVEQHHKRADAIVAREVIVALPADLSESERQELALDLARKFSDRYQVAVDLNLHMPSEEGDHRNYHAHLQMSACTIDQNGKLGKKAEELDPIHCQRHGVDNAAELFRAEWASMINERLDRANVGYRVDHRTLEAQGIDDRKPTTHLGPAVSGMMRRGAQSDVLDRIEAQAANLIDRARKAAAETQRALADAMTRIKQYTAELVEAKKEAMVAKIADWEAKAQEKADQRQAERQAAVLKRDQEARMAAWEANHQAKKTAEPAKAPAKEPVKTPAPAPDPEPPEQTRSPGMRR